MYVIRAHLLVHDVRFDAVAPRLLERAQNAGTRAFNAPSRRVGELVGREPLVDWGDGY